MHKVTVICKREPGPARLPTVDNGPTRNVPHVKAANLIVKGHDSLSGACSMNLQVGLETVEPEDHVKFRFESNDGQKSDVKSVITDSNGFGQYAFDYSLPAGGTKSGQVRIIGVGENFSSPWRDYEVDCGSSAQDLAAVLPPKATHLEGIATADTILYRGRVCPTTVKIWGILQGRGDASGAVAIFADNKLKVLKQYEAEDGQQIVIQGEHTLSWEGNQTGQQNVPYRMNVTNAVGDLVDHIEAAANFECKEPEVNAQFDNAPGGIASNDNLPKSVTLSLSTLGQKKLPGWICPERVRLHGNVTSDDQPLTGTAVLYASGSLLAEHDVELEANWGHNYDAEHEFSWNTAKTEQTMNFTLKFINQHGHLVKTVEKTENFACEKVSTSGLAAGGGEIGTTQPGQASQQTATGMLVQPQALPLSIMAPKGRVRKGEIRLSGGKPTQTYKLTFFRKSGGKTTQVSAAQLPKQMKGMNASFPLAALTGGRAWQLRVCPLGQGPAACKTSDFRIPLAGAKQDKAPSNPAAAVVVIPGIAN
ncbi:hypothetical protein [Pelagibius marinus]|uniref:hypothetical protein n=1 Tax=Pelagibius marinus TaxID=2762760 RepID=UPI0018725DA8|nr:hypothetical protein [Pelagibius marinus]